MYGQCMGHMWLRRLSRIWVIILLHNAYNVAHTLIKKSMARMWTWYGKQCGQFRRRNHILPIYCANVGSVANILPIYCPYCCQYMSPEIIFGLDVPLYFLFSKTFYKKEIWLHSNCYLYFSKNEIFAFSQVYVLSFYWLFISLQSRPISRLILRYFEAILKEKPGKHIIYIVIGTQNSMKAFIQ